MATLTKLGKEWYLHATLLKLTDFYELFEPEMTQEQRGTISAAKKVLVDIQNAIYA